MNNYGKSSIMPLRCKMLGYILGHFVESESLEGELCLDRAAATQNWLENTTGCIWEM